MPSQLDHLERCYWALTPSLARDVLLPLSLCRHQEFLATRLTAPEGLSGRWRRALWKRILEQIEGEIAKNDLADETELDERLVNALTSTMAADSAQLVRRRFIWHYEGQRCETNVQETESLISVGTTGLRTWQAAIRLANHLVAHPALIAGKDVLELGAGTGLVSFVASRLGARSVYATDSNEQVLEALALNCQLNPVDSIRIRIEKLDWCEVGDIEGLTGRCDLVLGADIVFDRALTDDIVACLGALLSRMSSSALIAATVRDEATWNCFTRALEAQGLNVSCVELDEPSHDGLLLGGHDEDTLTGAYVQLLHICR